MVDVTPLSQMDPRWKDKPLGFDTVTIGSYGCLMTCMTMLANCYGFNETPDTVNEKMKAIDGYQGALIIPALIPRALPGMAYRNFIQCRDQPAPLTEIDAYLSAGKPVIVEVDYAPNPGLQNHWLILYGKRGDDYLLRDPYPYPVQPGDVTLMTSRYKFGGTPAQIIQSVIFLEGASAPVTRPKVTLDKGVRASFPVYATADGLALRSEPVVADYTLIKRVAIGAKLEVLETDAAAKGKVGVLNQWLAVKDPADGCEGYTAAWYVAVSPSAKPTVPAARSGPGRPRSLVVKTVEEAVALRSRPEISEATLLKRVPVNTELLCLEPVDQARARVGVVYEWLKVQDVTKKECFVAAWYVTPVNGYSTLGVKDQASSLPFGLEGVEPEPLIVRASVEGLALRRLPLIMRETLLKRLPIDGELVVLDPPEVAAPRVGQMGDWLHVRDVEGDEGYVAAWYTILRPVPVIDENGPILG